MGPVVFPAPALAVRVAIVMIIVFGVITLVYPRIFAPKPPVDAGSEPGAPQDRKRILTFALILLACLP